MSKKLKELKEWAAENVTLVKLLPPNDNLEVTTRLIDVLEDEVDEKYYLSEEKTKKLTLDHDLGGKLNMYDYNERDKVHSVNKVSPTLNTMQGGDRQPKIAVLGNTSHTGYRAGNVHDVNGLRPTIAARDYKGAKQIAVPVLTPDRLNKRQNGRRFKEDGEPMFTLTSQDRHGVVIKDKGLRFTDDGFHTHRNDKKKSSIQGTHVTYKEGKTHALTSNHVPMTLQAGEVNQGVVMNDIRIRKLSPLECWRLQGFTDEQFYKAKESGVSNSQLYKQAGNSVTINVVDAIVKQLD